MLIYKTRDLLEADENIICHQVNTYSTMGGGLALQVAKKYPQVEKEYKEFCNGFKGNLLGKYQACRIANKKYIVNCFTQDKFNTDYEALEQVFTGLLESCKENNFTIAIPYMMGCGIAEGNWNKVTEILGKLSNEYEIDINVYKLEKSNE